jgi:polyhydroxyalkanoate synthesis regulator phasin
MPKKKNPETPEEQAKRFRAEARKLVKSGELDLEEGEAAIEALVKRSRNATGG